jgi:serine protease Do
MRIVIAATAVIYVFSLANGSAIEFAQGSDPCGWIGVQVSPMTVAFAESLGMAEAYGAIFGSPDANAGIEAGDVITSINGSPIMRSGDFAAMISAMAPNTLVYFNTFRDGQMIELKVTLGSGKCPLS